MAIAHYGADFRERTTVSGRRVDAGATIGTFFTVMLTAILAIAVTSLTLQYLHFHVAGVRVPDNLMRIVDMDLENNVPTWLSTINLALAGLLLLVIARAERAAAGRHALHYAGLSALFFALSVDEASSIHEVAINVVQRNLGTEGGLYSAWVIPGIAFVAVFGLVYLRFFLALPRRFQVLFAAAAALYVGGAIGMEIVGWSHFYPLFMERGWAEGRDFTYMVLNHVEEVMEMTGVLVFIVALMAMIRDRGLDVNVRFR